LGNRVCTDNRAARDDIEPVEVDRAFDAGELLRTGLSADLLNGRTFAVPSTTKPGWSYVSFISATRGENERHESSAVLPRSEVLMRFMVSMSSGSRAEVLRPRRGGWG